MFENALEQVNLSLEEPVLDETGEFLDAEMPDIEAEPPNLEGEAKSPVNDDNDAPVSEPPVAENEDPNDEEKKNLILWLRNREILRLISCDRVWNNPGGWNVCQSSLLRRKMK